jgi:glycopeptide antibiotics resistance protein
MPATGWALLWRLFELISHYMIAVTVAFATRSCLVWMIVVPWNGSSHICWKYDKSKHNFTIRKYQRVRHPFLDPVGAAI